MYNDATSSDISLYFNLNYIEYTVYYLYSVVVHLNQVYQFAQCNEFDFFLYVAVSCYGFCPHCLVDMDLMEYMNQNHSL